MVHDVLSRLRAKVYRHVGPKESDTPLVMIQNNIFDGFAHNLSSVES
jgi:hypothetical protein